MTPILNKYLSRLTERKVISKSANAPCVAYELVYGKKCPHKRGKNPSHGQKLWNNFYVDENLDNKWLIDLNNIKEIEMRSSCEGHDKNWIAFVIFRLRNKSIEKNKNKLQQIIINIESSDRLTKCAYDIGRQRRPRIIVAAPIWFKQPLWEEWWSTLALRIKKSLTRIGG